MSELDNTDFDPKAFIKALREKDPEDFKRNVIARVEANLKKKGVEADLKKHVQILIESLDDVN